MFIFIVDIHLRNCEIFERLIELTISSLHKTDIIFTSCNNNFVTLWTKRHDIAEILLMLALNTNQSINLWTDACYVLDLRRRDSEIIHFLSAMHKPNSGCGNITFIFRRTFSLWKHSAGNWTTGKEIFFIVFYSYFFCFYKCNI
jgi:hypothetical protein